jgi:hypothetical protein
VRSPIGPFLVVIGLATVVLIVLLLFQVIGLRSDVGRAEDHVAALESQVEAQEPGVTTAELRREIDELRAWTRDWLIATEPPAGGDVGTPAGSVSDDDDDTAVLRRIDLVLERIDALDARIDEICDGVPVC